MAKQAAEATQPRVSDGETGERARWIYWQRTKVTAHPAMEVAADEDKARIHQWDVCPVVLASEDYFPDRPESYKEDITGMLARLGNAVPEPVELGYHVCYGTPNDEHVDMPTGLANTVEIAHGILAGFRPPCSIT